MGDTSRPIELVKNRAHDLLDAAEQALERGEIDENEWYRRVAAVITPAYLAGDNPRAQSGKSGDEAAWERARSLIAEVIHKDGTFLDIGCASGYLMETLAIWTQQRGRRIEPYGLDIAPELAALACTRLPHWADRIHVGNAMDWVPPQPYDFVRTGLEYVPRRRQRDFITHLLKTVVAPGGRLIIGAFTEEDPHALGDRSTIAQLTAWGFPPAGQLARPHHDPRLHYRVLWIDTLLEALPPASPLLPAPSHKHPTFETC